MSLLQPNIPDVKDQLTAELFMYWQNTFFGAVGQLLMRSKISRGDVLYKSIDSDGN